MNRPSLLKEVEQFLYNYAPNAGYKKQLLTLVKTWEEAYQQRIQELETKPVVLDRVVEQEPVKEDNCFCEVVKYPPCSHCQGRSKMTYSGEGYDHASD